MIDLGIVRHGHALAYGWHHGFGRRWLPNSIQHLIVHLWNWQSCRWLGHNWMPDFDELRTVLEEDETGILYDWSEVQHRVCGSCCKREKLYSWPEDTRSES